MTTHRLQSVKMTLPGRAGLNARKIGAPQQSAERCLRLAFAVELGFDDFEIVVFFMFFEHGKGMGVEAAFEHDVRVVQKLQPHLCSPCTPINKGPQGLPGIEHTNPVKAAFSE